MNHEYICFNAYDQMAAAGDLETMLSLAEQHNYKVVQLITVRYRIPDREELSALSDESYETWISLVKQANEETKQSYRHAASILRRSKNIHKEGR